MSQLRQRFCLKFLWPRPCVFLSVVLTMAAFTSVSHRLINGTRTTPLHNHALGCDHFVVVVVSAFRYHCWWSSVGLRFRPVWKCDTYHCDIPATTDTFISSSLCLPVFLFVCLSVCLCFPPPSLSLSVCLSASTHTSLPLSLPPPPPPPPPHLSLFWGEGWVL